jgi:hypothetical protein
MRLPPGTRRAALLAVASCLVFVAFAGVLDPGLRPSRRAAAPRPQDDARIRAVLASYQRIYQDFYASGGGPTMIDDFPGVAAVKHEIFRDVGFVRDAGYVLVQDLAEATVLEVRATGRDTAEAVVLEEWNYVLQKSDDRRPASKLKGLTQGFRYRLRRAGDAWLVTGWDPEDVEAPPPSKERKW